MSKTQTLRGELRDEYIPRHIRLRGGSFDVGHFEPATREVVEIVPILSESGSVIAEKKVVRHVPAHETTSQYKHEDFQIDNLIKAGVKLEEINFDLCSRVANDELIAKALNLGLLSEEFSNYVPVEPVEPVKPSENE